MQAAWHAGHRRVRLFCADELRPSACCIVDALHTRGYEVSLFTGAEARVGLQQRANADVLRVIWAPEGPDKKARSRLRDALDPDAAGDVMVLAATTPRGVIEAIDAFGLPPRRSRLCATPRKTYLAQPTLMERKLETKHWATSALGAGAIALVLVGGLWLGARAPTRAVATQPARVTAESMSSPKAVAIEPVLASSRIELDFADDDDDEPIIFVEDAPPRGRSAAAQPLDDAPLEPAPLESPIMVRASKVASAIGPAVPVPGALSARGMPLGRMPGTRPVRAIDPF